MKSYILPITVVLFSLVFYILYDKLSKNEMVCMLAYILTSRLFSFDSNQNFIVNYHGEIEDSIFTHKFISIDHTAKGYGVNATYHVVECGSPDSEAIVFGHGMAENWRVWKEIMVEFCDTYHAIAYDSEGMGQSVWWNVKDDISNSGVTSFEFMADMQLQLLHQMGVEKFNLVVTDYSFWSTLWLTSSDNDVILRYGKFQSTVGVEDIKRIPQGMLIKRIPDIAKFIFNSNPFALPRVLMGKPLLPWRTLLSNKRIGHNPIDDKLFSDVILSGISKEPYTPWIYFYVYSPTLCETLLFQRQSFHNATYPVLMLQGAEDKGQPMYLFDGTAKLTINMERDEMTMDNRCVTTFSDDGVTPIGPTAKEFFPNSRWVDMRVLDGVGHFVHMEAPKQVIQGLRDLLSVPIE